MAGTDDCPQTAKPALTGLRHTLTLYCCICWYDARHLDEALGLSPTRIKPTTGLLNGSRQAEAMMRALAADNMPRFADGIASVSTTDANGIVGLLEGMCLLFEEIG